MDIRFYKDVGDYLHFEINKPFQMHIENEKKEKKLAVRELMKQMRRLNSNASCESIGDISFLPVSGNVKLSQILTSDSVLQSDNVALIFDVYDGTQTCRVLWMKEKEKGQLFKLEQLSQKEDLKIPVLFSKNKDIEELLKEKQKEYDAAQPNDKNIISTSTVIAYRGPLIYNFPFLYSSKHKSNDQISCSLKGTVNEYMIDNKTGIPAIDAYIEVRSKKPFQADNYEESFFQPDIVDDEFEKLSDLITRSKGIELGSGGISNADLSYLDIYLHKEPITSTYPFPQESLQYQWHVFIDEDNKRYLFNPYDYLNVIPRPCTFDELTERGKTIMSSSTLGKKKLKNQFSQLLYSTDDARLFGIRHEKDGIYTLMKHLGFKVKRNRLKAIRDYDDDDGNTKQILSQPDGFIDNDIDDEFVVEVKCRNRPLETELQDHILLQILVHMYVWKRSTGLVVLWSMEETRIFYVRSTDYNKLSTVFSDFEKNGFLNKDFYVVHSPITVKSYHYKNGLSYPAQSSRHETIQNYLDSTKNEWLTNNFWLNCFTFLNSTNVSLEENEPANMTIRLNFSKELLEKQSRDVDGQMKRQIEIISNAAAKVRQESILNNILFTLIFRSEPIAKAIENKYRNFESISYSGTSNSSQTEIWKKVMESEGPMRFEKEYLCDLTSRRDVKIAVVCTKEGCPACVRFEPTKPAVVKHLEEEGFATFDGDCSKEEMITLLRACTKEGDHATVPNLLLFADGKCEKIHPQEYVSREGI